MATPHSRSLPKKSGAPGGVTNPRKSLPRKVVTHVAHGTLFAVGLALAQSDVEEVFFKKKFFEAGVVDRLHAPITRYHE